MKALFLRTALLVALTQYVTPQTQPIVVKTKLGTVLGTRETKNYRLGHDIAAVDIYWGVPYAKPPVGSLRLQDPQPAEGWQGMRLARKRPPICPQPTDFPNNVVTLPYNITMDEDCLYLNIFSPVKVTNTTEAFPVLVYIHDGDFNTGSGVHFDGRILAHFGVVVVTINYRLGLLGFLSSGDRTIGGNFGLMDQVMALKWVKENIGLFRGDPEHVTVFGTGSGGVSVGLLMLSAMAKGLFSRAIISSGPLTPLSIMDDQSEVDKTFKQVVRRLKCPGNRMWEWVKCIQEMDWTSLTNNDELKSNPTVDGDLIKQPLEQLLQKGFLNPVPTILGLVEDEAMRWIALDEIIKNNSSDDGQQGLIQGKLTTLNIPSGLEELVYHEYGIGDRGGQSAVARRDTLSTLLTDRLYAAPTINMADHLARQKIPVYLYEFKHHLPMKTAALKKISWLGRYTYHGVDIPYIFGAPYLGEPQAYDWHQGTYDSEEKFFSRSVMKLWTNFVKHGDPSDITGVFLPIEWKQFRSNSTPYLHIRQDGATMRTHLRRKEMTFWNTILPALVRTSPTHLTPTQECPMSFFTEMTSLGAVSTILFLLFLILAVCLACRPRHQIKDASLIECNER